MEANTASNAPADPPPQPQTENGNGFVWPPEKTRVDDDVAASGSAQVNEGNSEGGAAAPVLSEKERAAIEKKRLRNKLNAQTQRNKMKSNMDANRKLIEEMRAQEVELDAALEEYKRKLAKYE